MQHDTAHHTVSFPDSNLATPECDFGCLHRTLGEELLLPPLYAFEETSTSAHTWANTAVNKVSSKH